MVASVDKVQTSKMLMMDGCAFVFILRKHGLVANAGGGLVIVSM